MATWTNVPDSNLEPGDPIRSVDIIAIKENTVYNREHTILDILNSQTFTASTTWTKPGGFDATDSVIAVVVGGGGSGYANCDIFGSGGQNAAGGGGGGVMCVSIPYGSIGSTVSVVVGAGGAAVTSSVNTPVNGNNGGTSSFGSYGALGGEGGGQITGGQGGAPMPISNATNRVEFSNGGRGNLASSGTSNLVYSGLTGGGGASLIGDTNRTGGTSLFFGSGGLGGAWNSSNGSAGSAPGGGGGGAAAFNTITSGAGARGEVRVYIVRGKVPANAFLGTTSVSVAY